MSQTAYSGRDPFKLNLQEENFNSIKKLSNLNMNSVLNSLVKNSERSNQTNKNKNLTNTQNLNNISKNEDLNEYRRNIISNQTNYMTGNEQQEYFNNSNYLDYNNEYLKIMIEKFRDEISILKNYINRINREIRKNLKIEIPLMEENRDPTIDIITKNKINDLESLVNFFNESLNRLINPEYLNPIFSIYDNHILNLENELKHYKILCSKHESEISELIKENNSLRDEILIKSDEMKDLLQMKVTSEANSTKMPLDLNFIKSLEDRNNLLSKENEILAMNYQKVSKDLLDFSLEYSEKHKDNLEKIAIFDKVNEELIRINSCLDRSILKNQVTESKVYELTEVITRIEIEKENFKLEVERLRTENHSLNEANLFYKNYIHKINSN